MTDWEGFLEESHRRLVDLRTYGRAQDAHATPYVVLREISLWDAKQSAAFPVLALSETAQSAIAREILGARHLKKFQFRVPSIECRARRPRAVQVRHAASWRRTALRGDAAGVRSRISCVRDRLTPFFWGRPLRRVAANRGRIVAFARKQSVQCIPYLS